MQIPKGNMHGQPAFGEPHLLIGASFPWYPFKLSLIRRESVSAQMLHWGVVLVTVTMAAVLTESGSLTFFGQSC
jgi:hypothetical protein